ncbi:hypothetical protein Cgig2_017424 [Carnegiea gigantea]|uniref:Pyrroline-5-carboxylate reductase n=1 Tax=Carnegiea gigantea TaxID=171969 RepID=A0A9Q1Q7N3_9CARY|nr:hypothetical protein Cgig2_017424 [Carnegiea gigantea]
MDPQSHQEQQQTETSRQHPKTMLLIRIMSKRRTWVALFVLVYGILLYSSWNLLQSILSWYKSTLSPSSSAARAVYASAMLGAVFGVISMAAAAAVAVPAMMVTWITVLVLLAFCGRRRRDLVVEAKKLTAEISGVVARILIKEGNFVAAVCAVLGYFLLVRKGAQDELC